MRPLLAGLVDYAGLFPPAALAMPDAVGAYAEYRRSANAWALGRFVVPVARLGEFAASVGGAQGDGAPWRLAALGGAGDREAVELFNVRHGARAVVDTVEAKAAATGDIAALAALASAVTPLGTVMQTFVEVPVATDPEPLVRAIATHGLRAKVRTGGVTLDAFPVAAQLARFFAACAAHDVAFKATAGLHHALRGEYALTDERGSARGTMFGFLNVFLAAMFLRAGLPESRAVELLEERDARAFAFGAGGVEWRGHRLDAAAIRTLRERFAASFGSCSFTEPVRDLAALGLL